MQRAPLLEDSARSRVNYQWSKEILPLKSPSVARRWYFKDDVTKGTTDPIGPATLKATSGTTWKNKGSLRDVPPGWYWVVFCVSFDGLDLDQINAMLFDARRGDATNLMASNKHTCETRITHDEIQHNLKAKAGKGMVRLRLHRQFEVARNDRYLHLTIGANLRSTTQSIEPQNFTLYYVELGTSSFQSAEGVEDYVLYGYGHPHQFISVDSGPSVDKERPTATKIRAYGFSDNGEFAVTLHLRDDRPITISPIAANVAETAITIEGFTLIAAANGLTTSAASAVSAARPNSYAVISIWDLRSPTNSLDADLETHHGWDPILYSIPCAEITTYLPEKLASPKAWECFRASISISTNGTKVALSGIDKSHGDLSFKAFDCIPQTGTDLVGGGRTLTRRTACEGLDNFSGYGVFHRINPDQSGQDNNNDSERFIAFSGPILEIYDIQSSVWTRLHRITLAQDVGSDRARFYGIAQGLRGRYFAWTGAGVVSIWDIKKMKLSSYIFVDTDGNNIQAVLSPDGAMVAISVNRSVQIYQRKTGILLGVHTKGVVSDKNSEVVLGNKYFAVIDNSLEPDEPAKIRSVVRIKDMAVVDAYNLQEAYHIAYPLSSAASVASCKQGSVLNIRRVTDIEKPKRGETCGETPCEVEEIDAVDDYQDQKTFTYISRSREVFLATTSRKFQNGCWNIVLNIAVGGKEDTFAPRLEPMDLFLGDESLSLRGFYLPQPSKLVIFAEGYMKIWKLSTTAAHVCQLDYIWGSHLHQPLHAATSCHRRLIKAWSCQHGVRMRFRLAKPFCFTSQQTVEGDPEAMEDDVFTIPPNPEFEKIKPKAVKSIETARFEYGIFGLIDIYGLGDPSRMDETIRYLLACIRPSTISPTSCLVPLCKAWSFKDHDILLRLIKRLLPMHPDVSPTWIPDAQATETTDPLAALLNIAKKDRSVIAPARVLIEYLFFHAIRSQNLTFLSPLFGNMREFMDMYPEDAFKYMGRIAYFRSKFQDLIWKNHVTCQNITPFRFPVATLLRRRWMSESEEKRRTTLNAIMQFRSSTNNGAGDDGLDLEKPIFIATFDALWFYKDRNRKTRRRLHSRGEGEGGGGGIDSRQSSTHRTKTFDAISQRLHSKGIGRWRVPLQLFWIKFFIRPRPVIECHDFKLEFLDNPAIAALVIFKWETIGFPYWFVRFLCQLIYYILVVSAALVQVYHPEPSRLYGVFIAIITMGAIFIILEVLQAIQDPKRYFKSHYNFADVVAFGVPTAAGIQQLMLILAQDAAGNNRTLSFSVLIVFLHMLLELRISRGVCKYVTIIQRAVSEITVFLIILAGCILAFTITILHLLKSCPYEGCTRATTNYPHHFIGGLSTTSFFLGGRFDAVADVLDNTELQDWSLHLVMIMFLFSTSILMMNVLIALINVAFNKGDDSWRKTWIESRLRYIEAAENLSYHIPGFRLTHDWFPNQIYFTATATEIEEYTKKHKSETRKHNNKHDDGEEDCNDEEDDPAVSLTSASSSIRRRGEIDQGYSRRRKQNTSITSSQHRLAQAAPYHSSRLSRQEPSAGSTSMEEREVDNEVREEGNKGRKGKAKEEESMDQKPTLAAIQRLDQRMTDQAQLIEELTKLVAQLTKSTSSPPSLSSLPSSPSSTL